jgi:hypothetical protein
MDGAVELYKKRGHEGHSWTHTAEKEGGPFSTVSISLSFFRGSPIYLSIYNDSLNFLLEL